MATRFYLPRLGTSPLGSLAIAGGWAHSAGSFFRAPALTAKSNTSLAGNIGYFPDATSDALCWAQFVSGRLAGAHDFTVEETASMVIRGQESLTTVDGYLAVIVRVVSGDGSTVRGTILDKRTDTGATEFSTSGTMPTRIWGAESLSAVSALSGDRIVIEIGMYGVTPAAAVNSSLYFGDPSATADFALTEGLTTNLCPWLELSPTIDTESTLLAGGSIALGGSADLFQFMPVEPLSADGTIQLSGSAILTPVGVTLIDAGGTILLSGTADLSVETYLAAAGTVALDGEAWLTTALHGEDTLQAVGTIELRGTALRLSTGETLPPTDDLGWTAPDVTTPDLRGLLVTVGGLSVKRAQITDLVIELDTEGGPKSATLSVNCALTRAPKLMQSLVVTYKGQTLFRGRLENISSNVDSSTGYTLTYAGPLVTLRDHKAYRTVFVDSDLQSWSTDQGPQTSPDTFEGIAAGV